MDALLEIVVMALELVPTSNILFDSDIPQDTTGKPRPYISGQPYSQPG